MSRSGSFSDDPFRSVWLKGDGGGSERIEYYAKQPEQPMTTDQLIDAVRQWGLDRNITGPTGKGTLLGQLSKTAEELTETRDAAMKWLLSGSFVRGHIGQKYTAAMLDQLVDGLGDTMVTLILAAEMAGLRIEDCLAAAYDEIKGRTGTMVNGQFVKA